MNGKRRMMKRETKALIINGSPVNKFIKLIKYHTRSSTEANALLKKVVSVKLEILGITKVITKVNSEAITVNNIKLS